MRFSTARKVLPLECRRKPAGEGHRGRPPARSALHSPTDAPRRLPPRGEDLHQKPQPPLPSPLRRPGGRSRRSGLAGAIGLATRRPCRRPDRQALMRQDIGGQGPDDRGAGRRRPQQVRMRRAASSPSMPGICTSIRIRSKPAGRRGDAVSRPRPSPQPCACSRMRRASMQLVALSSTTRIFRPCSRPSADLSLGGCGALEQPLPGRPIQHGRSSPAPSQRGKAHLAAHHLGQAPGNGRGPGPSHRSRAAWCWRRPAGSARTGGPGGLGGDADAGVDHLEGDARLGPVLVPSSRRTRRSPNRPG